MDNIKSNEDGTINFLTDIECEILEATYFFNIDNVGKFQQDFYIVCGKESDAAMGRLIQFLKPGCTKYALILKYDNKYCPVIIGNRVIVKLQEAPVSENNCEKGAPFGKLIYAKRIVSLKTGIAEYFVGAIVPFENDGMFFYDSINLLKIGEIYYTIFIFPPGNQIYNIELAK